MIVSTQESASSTKPKALTLAARTLPERWDILFSVRLAREMSYLRTVRPESALIRLFLTVEQCKRMTRVIIVPTPMDSLARKSFGISNLVRQLDYYNRCFAQQAQALGTQAQLKTQLLMAHPGPTRLIMGKRTSFQGPTVSVKLMVCQMIYIPIFFMLDLSYSFEYLNCLGGCLCW
jgi:hypothetical protein